ncbi:hypothetical protein COU37_02910 [Candidatus Micrarchaeota archaeon CG10_big_fil_rev_8_21_14_0_10_45_29]|nr:MAG: hypothetical protein COU37_02910 [Candidatus Micrarchaeota archaeon CG10_big_fil_rev_8_21_14_0_10_45_29]
MFGIAWITLKKAVEAVVISLILFFLAPMIGVEQAWINAAIISLWAGMLFVDVDAVTGWLKKMMHAASALVFLFIAILIFLFPASNSIASQVCGSSLLGASGNIVCHSGVLLLLLVVCYILARVLFGWIPTKDAFHNWFMMVAFTLCYAVLTPFIFSASLFVPAVLGFGIGYALHLIADHEHRHLK